MYNPGNCKHLYTLTIHHDSDLPLIHKHIRLGLNNSGHPFWICKRHCHPLQRHEMWYPVLKPVHSIQPLVLLFRKYLCCYNCRLSLPALKRQNPCSVPALPPNQVNPLLPMSFPLLMLPHYLHYPKELQHSPQHYFLILHHLLNPSQIFQMVLDQLLYLIHLLHSTFHFLFVHNFWSE